ncbi:MAG: hypothetical protein AAF725_27465, partial [Acidobacteriota bacterium]
AEALQALEEAQRLLPEGRESEYLAAIQFAIARALLAADREPGRARALAGAAREGFARGRASARDQVEAVDQWLASLDP